MFLFTFWLKNRPSIKYVRNRRNGGGSSKMCTDACRKWGVERSVIRYVRTKWMAPSKFCGMFLMRWFGQAHKSITASKEYVVVFFHHNYDYFILCYNQNLVYLFYIPTYYKKTGTLFSYTKKFFHKCMFKVPL